MERHESIGQETPLLNHSRLTERFYVLSTIGSGAAGIVYRVLDRSEPRRDLALKVMTDSGAFGKDNMPERFRQEWQVCQAIRHPNIIETYEFFDYGETLAYSMEYVSGSNLAHALFHGSPFSHADIDRIMAELLGALGELHRYGIVHRDVKLENILLRDDGMVKLGDMGLVKDILIMRTLTRKNVCVGTVPYMAPEYLLEGFCSAQADLYSAGILLYELVLKKRYYDGSISPDQMAESIKSRNFALPPEDLERLPERYRVIVQYATEPSLAARYASANEMQAAFKEEAPQPPAVQRAGSEPLPAEPAPKRPEVLIPTIEFPRELRRDHTTLLLALLCAAMLVILVSVLYLFG